MCFRQFFPKVFIFAQFDEFERQAFLPYLGVSVLIVSSELTA
jgi:hypothetical protein